MTDSPQIRAIRARYKASFSEKSQELRQHQEQLASSSESPEVLVPNVKEYLHKLAGSSGMYGYTEIAEACRAGMAMCDAQNTDDLQNQISKIIDLLASQS